MTAPPFLLYGATGYTGTLIAEAAVARGLRPVLAGRNAGALKALAARLDLPWRAVALDDQQGLADALEDTIGVLHCAGPFSATAAPMVEACLRARRHYLDVTGELAVFEALRGRSAVAHQQGIMLLPGVGFDVVPSDCLLAHVHHRLPSATRLRLVISSSGQLSHGTAATMLEHFCGTSFVRRQGQLVAVPLAGDVRTFDIDGRRRSAVLFPWGDLSTAQHSTGVSDIEVWFTFPPSNIRALRAAVVAAPLLRTSFVRRLLQSLVPTGGPSKAERAAGRCVLLAEAESDAGEVVRSCLQTPDGYTHTVETALLCMSRVAAGEHPPGYQTPSSAYGPDLVLQAPGTARSDLSSSR
ncbi:MAG: hypothetical protein FJ137_08150 [Deltaproteobacteria bacterium]|nr:hypothetical protein [Deltaproteobacteria bacterium]